MPPLRAGRTWAHRAAECYGRLCPHHPQLTSSEDRYRHRRQGKEQIVRRLTSPLRDQHMHQRQRQAGTRSSPKLWLGCRGLAASPTEKLACNSIIGYFTLVS